MRNDKQAIIKALYIVFYMRSFCAAKLWIITINVAGLSVPACLPVAVNLIVDNRRIIARFDRVNLIVIYGRFIAREKCAYYFRIIT